MSSVQTPRALDLARANSALCWIALRMIENTTTCEDLPNTTWQKIIDTAVYNLMFRYFSYIVELPERIGRMKYKEYRRQYMPWIIQPAGGQDNCYASKWALI